MLFGLEVLFLRIYMIVFKTVVAILPFKWPQTFEGPDSSLTLCRHIHKQGHSKVLLVTDTMLLKLGLLDKIKAELDSLKLAYVVYDGVQPDPTIEQIETGYAVLADNGCDAILAVGGGSCIDAAKMLGARAKNNKSVAKMAGLFRVFWGILPLYAVPTTAGTGSEVTIAAVISDPVQQRKLPVMDPKLIPSAAALDSALMVGLPPAITAATGMDALTHAVEAYLSRNAMKKTDELAVQATHLIMNNLETTYTNGGNLEARQKMAHASHLAGIAFTQAGVGYVHAIAHKLGALYHVPHGLANAIVLPYVLEYSKPNCQHRLAQLARACDIGPVDGNDAELAEAFIQKIREMNAAFDIPSNVKELKASDINEIAKSAVAEARFTYAVPRYMNRESCAHLVHQLLPA